MRLTDEQHQLILQSCEQVLLGLDYRVYLFGSRLDDRAKGGDIDLLIILDESSIEQELDWKQELKARIEQKTQIPVDIVIQNESRPIKVVAQIAMQEGVLL